LKGYLRTEFGKDFNNFRSENPGNLLQESDFIYLNFQQKIIYYMTRRKKIIEK